MLNDPEALIDAEAQWTLFDVTTPPLVISRSVQVSYRCPFTMVNHTSVETKLFFFFCSQRAPHVTWQTVEVATDIATAANRGAFN